DEVSGLVARINEMRSAVAARRGRAVAVNRDLDRDNRAGLDLAQLRAGAPVDSAGRQVEEEVYEPWLVLAPEQAAIQFLELRADTRKRRDRREERIEQSGPHTHRHNSETGGLTAALSASIYA